jgi:hypothetical protein
MVGWSPASTIKGLFDQSDPGIPPPLPLIETVPAGEIQEQRSAPPTAKPATPSVQAVALAQRRLLICILMNIVVYILVAMFTPPPAAQEAESVSAPGGSAVLSSTVHLLWLGLGVYGVYCVAKLATALNLPRGSKLAYVVTALVPGFALFSLLMLNAGATYAVRSAGFRVRLLGADPFELARGPAECTLRDTERVGSG